MSISDVNSLVAVNVGNTSVGVGLFERFDASTVPEPQVDLTFDSRQGDFGAMLPLLSPHAAAWYVTSVSRPAERRLRQWIRVFRPDDSYRQLGHVDFPLGTAVEYPEQIGVDRWAGAVAANALRHPDHGAIVVDAGTAITVNAVSAAAVFLGGAIFPGRRMSASALCAQTDLLPFIEVDRLPTMPPAVGTTTEEAIRAGLYWGTMGALGRLIGEMERFVPTPRDLFVTGGGMPDLVNALGEDAKFVSNLVLRGIAVTAGSLQRAGSRPEP